MSYYKTLGLEKEPFSNSPDPSFLYRSNSHRAALHRLEIAVRLKRGLCLLLGDVGTGKTTIARTLIRAFKDEPDYVFHMVLDPYYENRADLVSSLCRILGLKYVYSDDPEIIERYFFQQGVVEGKTVVLIIDEGQKLSPAGIEMLRTLLNYETNEHKLLQLIIMAQLEFLEKVGHIDNFMDRVAYKYVLNPLDEEETKKMIEYRLVKAGYRGISPLFADDAVTEIHKYTKGYPRKITRICHEALEHLIMYDKSIVDIGIISEIIKNEARFIQAHEYKKLSPSFREGPENNLQNRILN